MYLAQSDRLIDSLRTGSIKDPTELTRIEAKLGTWIASLFHRLHRWKEIWVDSALAGQFFEVSNLGSDSFPIFRCRDSTTMEIVTPNVLAYQSLEFAYTMCTYYAAYLILAAADLRPSGTTPAHENYTYACNICRSIEFFIRFAPGQLILRIGFPLRVAYETLPYGGVERRYVEEIFQLIGQRYNLNVFSDLMPEISGRRREP